MRARCGRSYVRGMTDISQHRTSGDSAVCGVAADFRPGVRPVSLAGGDRRHAPPAKRAAGQRLRAGRRDRRRTGLNIAHYPDEIAELVLTEPDASMRRQTHAPPAAEWAHRADRRRACGAPTARRCVSGHRRLDACPLHRRRPRTHSGRDRTRAPPGGQLLFLEHVRASSRLLAACQDYLFRPWRGFAGGCYCNRPTADLMRAAGLLSQPTTACGVACRRSSIRSLPGARLGPRRLYNPAKRGWRRHSSSGGRYRLTSPPRV